MAIGLWINQSSMVKCANEQPLYVYEQGSIYKETTHEIIKFDMLDF